jgi:hypothetical protein
MCYSPLQSWAIAAIFHLPDIAPEPSSAFAEDFVSFGGLVSIALLGVAA